MLVIPVALVAIGLAARAAGERAFRAFTAYHPRFTFAAAPLETTPPLTRRVLLVLMDGLGVQASRSMPFLNELRARGAALECRVGLPSLSMPARAVLMTGAWADIHGQTTNYGPRPLVVDHLFRIAREGGRSTALAGGTRTQTLFAPHVQRHADYDEEPETAPFAHYQAVLQRNADDSVALLRTRPDLAQVELNLADEAGHGWGARSPEYAQAALLVDAALRRLAAEVDLAADTLVVTADHGHVAGGGHGGPEPEVMQVPLVLAGSGIRAGATGTCTQADIAPTLAVLMGLRLPTASQGTPLLDALDAAPGVRRTVLANVLRQRHAFVDSYVFQRAVLEGGYPPSGPPALAPVAVAAHEGEAALARRIAAVAEEETRQRARMERATAGRRRWHRLYAVTAGLLLLQAAFAVGVATSRQAALAAAFALGGVALYHAALPAAGLAYSLTAVNKDEWLQSFFTRDMVLGVAACALAAAALCLVLRRRGRGWLELSRMAWLCAAAFCAVFLLKAAWVSARYDMFARASLPDARWGMAFYLDVLVLMAVGLAAPALALVAALALLLPPHPGMARTG